MRKAPHPTRRTLCKSVFSIVETLEDRRLLSAGQLDTSFGSGGIAPAPWAQQVGESLVLSDGKILVLGFVTPPDVQYPSAVSIARYNPNGTLDTTFGNAGVSPSITNADPDYGVLPLDIALQSDGRIIVATRESTPNSAAVRLSRFNANGTLDTTFGGAAQQNGSIAVPGAGFGSAQSLGITADNKIIVGSTNSGDFVITRLNANGTPDTAFANGRAYRRIDFGGANPTSDVLAGIAIASDGKIVAAGFGSLPDGRGLYEAARLNPDGTFDNLFHGGHAYILDPDLIGHVSGSGLFVPSYPSASIALLPDGRVQVMALSRSSSSSAGPELRSGRFTNRGSTDITFGAAGIAGSSQPFAPQDAELQADGMVVLAGATVSMFDPMFGNFDSKTAMLRLNQNGFVDSSFNLEPSLKGKAGIVSAVSLQPDQKVVASASLWNGDSYEPRFFRLLNQNSTPPPPPPPPPTAPAAGRIDATFKGAGDWAAWSRETVVLPNGKILVTGTVNIPYEYPPGVARLNPNGSLDTTFGNGGVASVPIDPHSSNPINALDLATQSDGEIVLLMSDNGGSLYVARFKPNGTFDSNFGISNVAGAGFGDIQSLAIGQNNEILVGSTDQDDFVITRLTADGFFDNTFGNGVPYRRLDFGGASRSKDYLAGIAVQSDGKIVAGGVSILADGRSVFSAARLNPDGTYDTTFHGGHAYLVDPGLKPRLTIDYDGKVSDVGAALALYPDGRVGIAASSTATPNLQLRLARFTNRGSADTTLGPAGIAATSQNFEPVDTEIQADGKLLVAGARANGFDPERGYLIGGGLDILRFTAAGASDSTFKLDPNLAGRRASIGIALQPDQKIIIASGEDTNTGQHALIARVLNDGATQQPPPTTTQKPFKWPFGEREIIQAEWFDYGGEGVAYHDDTPGNQGMGRDEGVDTFATNNFIDGNLVVVPNQGEWIEYTIRSPFATTRNFNLQSRYATTRNGVVLDYYIDGQKAGSAALAPTGGAETFQNSSTTVSIAPGTHVLRVQVAAGGTNVGAFDWFRFVAI